jgi:UDP-2-acetamido-2,6-beta-L-arabino-hexul-4-ose reductase
VVATFCHNLARQQPIQINDPAAEVTLVYVDDAVSQMLELLDASSVAGQPFVAVQPEYRISIGALAEQIKAFREVRSTLVTERVGVGLTRALYATYISHLPVEDFVYDIPSYSDPRGTFAEMLKTADSGQFSFFTAHPGVTRGGHYHHSKTEKFLVIQGEAHFRFRHLLTGATHEVRTSGAKPQIVETIPGWAHDISNTGSQQLIVMLWANEVFDRVRPDTVSRTLP